MSFLWYSFNSFEICKCYECNEKIHIQNNYNILILSIVVIVIDMELKRYKNISSTCQLIYTIYDVIQNMLIQHFQFVCVFNLHRKLHISLDTVIMLIYRGNFSFLPYHYLGNTMGCNIFCTKFHDDIFIFIFVILSILLNRCDYYILQIWAYVELSRNK